MLLITDCVSREDNAIDYVRPSVRLSVCSTLSFELNDL